MGCDGGTIPTRDELVRTKKKPEQKDKTSERLYKWQHCSLTQEPLSGKRIVACQLGRLYNKEAILEALLSKSLDIDHVRSIKDFKDLELTANPATTDTNGSKSTKRPSVGDNYVDHLVSPWICPVTGLEMNGRFKFVFDWSNGKVMSERAYKMLKNDDMAKIAEENMIVLNPEQGEELDRMTVNMEGRKARAKAEKKTKKKNKVEVKEESKDSGKKRKNDEMDDKKSKTAKSQQSSTSASVQNDKTKSEVFKSLFSSHSSAQNKPKGHWVTFDPRYN